MDFTKIPIFSALTARLDFLAARSSVIAKNIANADTPNYVAKDVSQKNFKTMAASQMRVSDPRHMVAPAQKTGASYRIERAPDGEASLTGNQVSVETQAMKLSQTRQDYALATTIYRKGLDMIRLAVRNQ